MSAKKSGNASHEDKKKDAVQNGVLAAIIHFIFTDRNSGDAEIKEAVKVGFFTTIFHSIFFGNSQQSSIASNKGVGFVDALTSKEANHQLFEVIKKATNGDEEKMTKIYDFYDHLIKYHFGSYPEIVARSHIVSYISKLDKRTPTPDMVEVSETTRDKKTNTTTIKKWREARNAPDNPAVLKIQDWLNTIENSKTTEDGYWQITQELVSKKCISGIRLESSTEEEDGDSVLSVFLFMLSLILGAVSLLMFLVHMTPEAILCAIASALAFAGKHIFK